MSILDKLKEVHKKIGLASDAVDKAVKYLRYYKYIKDDFSLDDFAGGLVRLQKQVGLSSSGELTPKTLRAMDLPRCGCPERLEEANQLNKWGLSELTVHISSRDNDLSKELWDEAIIKALESVEAVCGLRFRIIQSSSANIVIGVGRGRRDQFDGPSGTLGWCQLPTGSNYRGQVESKLDADELWVYPTGRGIFLQNVVCHEIGGHGLGLPHTDTLRSLMNPFYSQSIATPQEWEIKQLQLRYGKPSTTPENPPTNPPSPDDEVSIIVKGQISSLSIPGYRVTKIE